MFDQAGDEITEKAPEAAAEEKKTVAVAPHKRKPKSTLDELAARVPEEAVVLDLPDAEKYTQDHRPLKYIGMDLVRTELVREPERVYAKKYYVRTYADPIAEALTGYADIRRPTVPVPLLPHSYASASVVTDVIVKKFADALPLYRQEQMWKRLGVNLKRNTMANRVVLTAETYLKPFSDAFLAELLRKAVIHADETVLQLNREPGREATAESRIWAYASSRWQKGRSSASALNRAERGPTPRKVLSGFTGWVV